MHSVIKAVLIIGYVLVFEATHHARAQSYGAGMGAGINFGNLHMNNLITSTIADQVDDQSATRPREPEESEQGVQNAVYTSSTSRTRTNLQNFATKSRAQDPAGAAQMEQFFSSTDVIGQIGNAMKPFGLSPNNVADIYAVWWVSAWQASQGDTSDVRAETYQAVSAQAARGLSTSPQFAQATDAQKQEMAEALMIQAALIDAHMESAAGNAEQLQAVAKAVSQGAAASGLELDKMVLTEKGFAESQGR